MYMNTRANLDYWSTDNCCLKWSLRTGAITIGILCLLWQALMVAFGVMMIVTCTSNTTITTGNTTTDLITTDVTSILTHPDDTSSSDLFSGVNEPLITGDVDSDNGGAEVRNMVERDISDLEAMGMMMTDSGNNDGGDENDSVVEKRGGGGDGGNELVMDNSGDSGDRRGVEGSSSSGSGEIVRVTVDGDAEKTVNKKQNSDDGIMRIITLATNDSKGNVNISKNNRIVNNSYDSKKTSGSKDIAISTASTTSTTNNITINEGVNIDSSNNNTINSNSTGSSDGCTLNSTDEEDDNSTRSNFTCAWLPGPETEVLGVHNEEKLMLVAGLFITYSGIYCILSLCVIVGSITNSVSLLQGWVAFTGFHNVVILASLLVPLPFTTLAHLLLSIAYFILSLYTWAVVKSHMHALKVEKNKPLLPEGSITDYTVDGVDVTEIPVQV